MYTPNSIRHTNDGSFFKARQSILAKNLLKQLGGIEDRLTAHLLSRGSLRYGRRGQGKNYNVILNLILDISLTIMKELKVIWDYELKEGKNKGKDNKTSIMINLSDKPGSLLSILKPFAENDINMTRIETRPSRNNDFQHTFFIDFEGYYEDDKVAGLISTLEQMSKELRIIGSYEILY